MNFFSRLQAFFSSSATNIEDHVKAAFATVEDFVTKEAAQVKAEVAHLTSHGYTVVAPPGAIVPAPAVAPVVAPVAPGAAQPGVFVNGLPASAPVPAVDVDAMIAEFARREIAAGGAGYWNKVQAAKAAGNEEAFVAEGERNARDQHDNEEANHRALSPEMQAALARLTGSGNDPLPAQGPTEQA